MTIRRKILSAVAVIAAAVFALPTISRSQALAPPQPFQAFLTSGGPAATWFPLSTGLGTCSVIVDNLPSGASVVPQVTSDTVANQNAGIAPVVTATGVGSGSITTAGTYVGNVSSTGLTGFRPAPSGTFTGTISVRYFCTNASSSGAGGSGGSVSVTNTPGVTVQNTPGVNVVNTPGVVVANSSANPVPVAPPTGTYAVSIATTVPVALPTNADGGANVHVTNTAAPGINVAVNPTATYAPLNLDANGGLLSTITGLNNAGTNAILKTTNSITAGAGSTLGLLGVGLCSGATSAPYCAAVNANSQLAVSNPYNGVVNQALQTQSFQGFGCVSSALPGSLVTGDFEPCFQDLNGNIYVTSTPAFNGGSGTITALNGAVVIPTQGYGSVGVTISGTFTGTVTMQASSDGGVTYPVTITLALATGTSTTTSVTAPGTYKANVAPYDHVRIYDTAYTSGTITVNYALGSTPYAPTITGYGTQYATICSNNTTNCVAPGTLSAGGNALGNAFATQSNTLFYNGSTLDLARKDTYTAGPIWVTPGGATNLGIAVGVPGPTVVKASAGRIVQFLVTTAGTTSETFYDNASACSGTIIGITPATTAVGSVYTWNYTAVNGITACGATTTSPAGTLAYF